MLRFDYRYGDNEKNMCADMVTSHAGERSPTSGFEITRVDRDPADRGLLGARGRHRAHGQRPEDIGAQSVPQAHDVKNLFVVDGAGFVSAACQNPTWTIMALAWRGCDYLAAELKRGNL